ncbi:MAG: Gfo/Idh/MocA family oxidoreductase [Anaerolineae bacterium]|nr:Gfo/Idh/MocA family oxidoreductase [Anaerolineae bacterium]
MTESPVCVAMIGCGWMARLHIQNMLQQQDTTRLVVVSEPSPAAYEGVIEIFSKSGLQPPPNEPDLTKLLSDYADELDAAFIITPHAYHFEQACACLEAGLDVLLEKPMVITADEARRLIETRDSTGQLLVIAFNGSLSSSVRTAVRLLRSGELGEILSVNATVWEGWAEKYTGHWKQNPAISGGGFMFDTGAHMLNTVSDLVGEDFTHVAAWLDNRTAPVDLVGVVIGRLASGALVTMQACGATMDSLGSEVKIFCTKGILRTGVWGEFFEVQRPGETQAGTGFMPTTPGAWQQFLAVRSGQIENPSPPEIGLRMAKLWDAIQLSAARDGAMVSLNDRVL